MKAGLRSVLGSLPLLAALPLPSAGQSQWPPEPLPVARLRFQVPTTPYSAAPEMVVRGTIPLPPDIYFEGDPVPFKVIGPDGELVSPTQVEIVSRYADPQADGVDVVEIIARIERDPTWVSGDRETVDVTTSLGGAAPDPGTPDLQDLVEGPEAVPTDVQDLLETPQGIAIVGHGPQGEEYVCFPLDGTGTMRTDRYGPVQSGLRVYQALAMVNPLEGDLLTLAGVHTYLETTSEENALRLSVRFNNANADLLEAAGDDPRGEVYFDRISLYIVDDALDWSAREQFIDPFGINTTTVPTTATLPGSPLTYRVYPLVSSLGGGKFHVLFCRSQFFRRLVIAPAAEFTAAAQVPLRMLHQDGQAFSMWGQGALGNPFWSWWNEDTARYFAQRQLLAKLNFTNASYGGGSAMLTALTGWYTDLRNALATNSAIPAGPFGGSDEQLGWARPLYDPYAGTTGGSGIQFVEGDRTAAVASLDGYRYLMLLHRLITERMNNVLYHVDGDPASYDDFVEEHAGSGELYYTLQGGFQMDFGSDDEVFCPDVPLWNQNEYVGDNNGQPPYYAELQSYTPIDTQHLCRATKPSIALAWLGNDPIAEDDVRAQAELYRMTFSEHPNQAGNSSGWSLSDAREEVLASLGGIPAWGFDVGRGEGWGIDVVNAAFALQDDAWRASVGSWYEKTAELFHVGLGLTSDTHFGPPYPWGFLVAKRSDKLYGDEEPVRARQTWEDMILALTLRGMQKTVFAPSSDEHDELAAVADALSYGFLAPVAWNESLKRVWDIQPMTPHPYPGSPLIYNCDQTVSGANCTGLNPLPLPAYPPMGTGNSTHYASAPLGDAAGETGNALFIQRAYEVLTGQSCTNCSVALKDELEDLDPRSNFSGWSNKVHLLGLLQ